MIDLMAAAHKVWTAVRIVQESAIESLKLGYETWCVVTDQCRLGRFLMKALINASSWLGIIIAKIMERD